MRSIIAVFGIALVGCTSKSVVSGDEGISSLANATSENGVVQLVDAKGHKTPIDPASEIVFQTLDGRSTDPVAAGDLCRTRSGLTRAGNHGCNEAEPIVDWDEIQSFEVKTFDGALSTVVASAAVGIVVGGLLVARAGSFGGGGNGGGSGGGGGGGGRGGGGGSGGGGGGGGAAGSHVSGGSSGSHVGLGFHVWNVGGGGSWSDADRVEGDAPTPRPARLFSDWEIRKRTAAVLVTVDGGGCAFQPDGHCPSGGVRGGVRVVDFVEISLGARMFSGLGSDVPRARWMAMAGLGFHGAFPNVRWLALAFTVEGGFGDGMWSVGMRPGLRVRPAEPFWIGIYPVTLAYTEWTSRRVNAWNAPSMIELAAAF